MSEVEWYAVGECVVGEWEMWEAVEEIEGAYEIGDLNEMEGLARWGEVVYAEGPVVVLVVE